MATCLGYAPFDVLAARPEPLTEVTYTVTLDPAASVDEKPFIIEPSAPVTKSRSAPFSGNRICGVPRDILNDFDVEVLPSGVSVADFMRRKVLQMPLEEAFYVLDFAVLIKQFKQWRGLLPRVEPFYAVKCNSHAAILRLLASLGVGFDCASAEEVRMVTDIGVSSSRIIFANACKIPNHIRHCTSVGVEMMTFDNALELHKIAKLHPASKLVLRILPDDSYSLMKFGSKFGAPFATIPSLLRLARELGLDVIGVSFHVGSGCFDAAGFREALQLARRVFDTAKEVGYSFRLLDIGGGFPGSDDHTPSFAEIAGVISPLLDELFGSEVRVIGEPGRYFAAETQTLATNIYAVRENEAAAGDDVVDSDPEARAPQCLYYMDDGVYGSFNCIVFDHYHPQPLALFPPATGERVRANLFGPTCDSMDLVCKNTVMPKLAVGDWLYFERMGAYTSSAASAFNGFKTRTFFYVLSTAIAGLDGANLDGCGAVVGEHCHKEATHCGQQVEEGDMTAPMGGGVDETW